MRQNDSSSVCAGQSSVRILWQTGRSLHDGHTIGSCSTWMVCASQGRRARVPAEGDGGVEGDVERPSDGAVRSILGFVRSEHAKTSGQLQDYLDGGVT